MRIDARTAAASLDAVRRLFDRMEQQLADGRAYLEGDVLTAADLTLAALAAPTVAPPEHQVRFPAPETLPPEAAALVRECRERPMGAYLLRIYRDHRGSRAR